MLRTAWLQDIVNSFKVHPIVGLLGPRQCGKTTLARKYLSQYKKESQAYHYFDLEDTTDLARLMNPKLALEGLQGLIIIDEIQRRPDLFPILRVLIDKKPRKQRYLILGSASKELIKQSSESLAGRIGYIELTPFSIMETHQVKKLWIRGGFPLSYLASSNENSYRWREEYIRTFLERDIPSFGIRIPPLQLKRFWMMLSHYHGNIFNASEIGRSLALSHNTIRQYTDILVSTFMIRELQPWFENVSKRQVKSSKIYFRDSGLLHTLSGIKSETALLTFPKIGASWEGFALEEIIRYHKTRPEECYFWATQGHAELDLLIIKDGKKLGFEFKYTDAPAITRSMNIAKEDLKLDKLTVIFPGKQSFPLSKDVFAVGLENYLAEK